MKENSSLHMLSCDLHNNNNNNNEIQRTKKQKEFNFKEQIFLFLRKEINISA